MSNASPAARDAEAPQGVAASERRRISLSKIKVDRTIQQRVGGTSPEVVAKYAEAMGDGASFPSPIVFSDDGASYRLADGFHRLAAYRVAHPDEQQIECEVKPGSHEDALLFACGANATHGLPRTRADKEKIVLLLLRSETWSLWSDREIAHRCQVSHPYVGKLRHDHLETLPDTGEGDRPTPTGATPDGGTTAGSTDDHAAAPDDRRSFMRGGKQLTMKTGKIGTAGPTASKMVAPPPSAKPGKNASADRDRVRMERVGQLQRHIHEIEKLLADADPGDRDMIRKNFTPYLDAWFKDGKLREPIVVGQSELPPGVDPGPEQPIGPITPSAAVTPPPPPGQSPLAARMS